MNSIYENIQDVASGKGLSIKSVAVKSGIGENSIYRLKDEEYSPTIKLLNKIAVTLDVTTDSLINGSASSNNSIKTEIAFRNSDRDELTYVYSPADISQITQMIENTEEGANFAQIPYFAKENNDFYDAPEDLNYGSNHYYLANKPTRIFRLIIPVNDIAYMREVDYE